MKKIITFCVALCATVAIFAQQQMATLNHNDTITAFYGASALQQAHAAAVHGDVITLSSGTFSSVNISKAVTIRGNGFEDDTIAGTTPTIVTTGTNGASRATMDIPSSGEYNLSLEGLRLEGEFRYYRLTSPLFTKCMFTNLTNAYEAHSSTGDTMRNATFTNCIITNFNMPAGGRMSSIVGAVFVNSVIVSTNIAAYTPGIGGSAPCNVVFRNCIVNLRNTDLTQNTYSGFPFYTCYNSILFYNATSNSNNTANCYNCIGINCSADSTIRYFNNNTHGDVNYHGLLSVFKYFSGTYYAGMNFELQDSIRNNILGNDGTEVGIYGGMVPYSSRVNSPRFVRCNVAPHTTLDGKLSVDIEVVSE